MLIMKNGKRQTMEGIELLNQERTRTLREKKNDNYLRKSEADIIKQTDIKEKRKSQTNEKDSRNQTLLQEYHKRDKPLGCLLCNILRTILKLDKGGSQKNGPEDKKVDDDIQVLTSKRWHRLNVFRKEDRNIIKKINPRVASFVIYSGPFLNCACIINMKTQGPFLEEQRKTNYRDQ